jgi:hypothetical protein
MLFKNSVFITRKTKHISITNMNWLMMFKEITTACSENHTNFINRLYSLGKNAELFTVISCGTYIYQCMPTLKVYSILHPE